MNQPTSYPHRPPPAPAPARAAGRVAAALLGLIGLAVGTLGPPWALVTFVGWPLPDQVPTPETVWVALSVPPSTSLVMDVLACICWVAWAAFVLDVVVGIGEALVSALSWSRGSRSGGFGSRDRPGWAMRPPAWRPGAALVGIVLVALLAGSRPVSDSSAVPAPATVSQLFHAGPQLLDLRPVGAPLHGEDGTAGQSEKWVQVRPPTAAGVHDSLWRIADRELGDPTRWPELFDRNAGHVQADGHTLRDPDLIQPGWSLAVTAGGGSNPGRGRDGASGAGPDTATPQTTGPRPAESGDRPEPTAGPSTATEAPPAPAPGAGPGVGPLAGVDGWVEVGPTVVVTAGFATVLAAALALAQARRQARRRRVSAEGEEPFPVLPVVREIARRAPRDSLAADRVEMADDTGDEHVLAGRPSPAWNAGPDRARPDPAGSLPSRSVWNAPEWAPILDAARDGNGLGLAGPGAAPALRALLVDLLLDPNESRDAPSILVAGGLAEQLGFGVDALSEVGVSHALDLDAAISSSLLVGPGSRPSNFVNVSPTVVMAPVPAPPDVTSPAGAGTSGRGEGVLVLLHGPWPAGVTAYVRADGAVVAAGPATYGHLTGHRLPVLDVHTAAETLDLVQTAGQHEPTIAALDQDGSDVPTGPGGDVVVVDSDDADGATPDHLMRDGAADGDDAPAETASPVVPAVDRQGPQETDRPPWMLNLLGPSALIARYVRRSGDDTGDSDPGYTDTRRVSVSQVDVTRVLSPRMRDLLVFLALHPQGVRRDAIVNALWPDTGAEKPGNNLSALISRLRSTIRSADPQGGDRPGPRDAARPRETPAERVILVDGDRYRLDPDCIAVDYWAYLRATAAATAPGPGGDTEDPERLAALHAAHDLYRGPLADGIDHEWILSVREAARRAFLTTTSRLVRYYVASDPASALHILEITRNLEPANEMLYRDIIALQLRLGDNSGAAETMRLLETQLADIDETPGFATLSLVQDARANSAGTIRSSIPKAVPAPRRPSDSPAMSANRDPWER